MSKKTLRERIIKILEKGIIPTDDLRGYIINRKRIADQILELVEERKVKDICPPKIKVKYVCFPETTARSG